MPNNKPDLSQFGSAKPPQTGDPRQCAQCEAMLTDALDGTLTPADQAAFDLHLVGCPACSAMTADAQRGAAWLEMLKNPRPEPPAGLLDRILAQTSGIQTSGIQTSNAQASSAVAKTASNTAEELSPNPSNTLLGRPILLPTVSPAQTHSNVLPFRSRFTAGLNLRHLGQTLLQPRLAMTAAMAFFSVALTLNLTGVRLSDLRASDFRPSSIKRSVSEANAHVVRYYDNLRVVYELESRVHDLQHSGDSTDLPAADPKTQPAQQPSGTRQPNQKPGQKNSNPDSDGSDQAKPHPRPGTSRRENLGPNFQFVAAESANPDASPVPYLSQSLATLLPSIDRSSLQQDRATGTAQEGTLV